MHWRVESAEALPGQKSKNDSRILHDIRVSAQHFREIYQGVQRFIEHGAAISYTECNINNQLLLCFRLIRENSFEKVEVYGTSTIRFDQTLLRTIFIELLTNAIKYAPPRQKPKLIIQIVECEATDSNPLIPKQILSNLIERKYCYISFSDNGIGIDEDEIDQVFDLGFRSPLIREHIPGTGSGLAICRYFVEQARGAIWIDSTRFFGTTVNILLPTSEKP
jgi:signal transduction histidine kinase